MANFTINSLAKTTPLGSDKLIKSDINGVLSSTTVDDLKNAIYRKPNFKSIYVMDDSKLQPIFSGALSVDTKAEMTLKEENFTVPADGDYMIFVTAVIKTNNTSKGANLSVLIDGTKVAYISNSLTTPLAPSVITSARLTQGNHSIKAILRPSGSSGVDGTATLYNYSSFQVSVMSIE